MIRIGSSWEFQVRVMPLIFREQTARGKVILIYPDGMGVLKLCDHFLHGVHADTWSTPQAASESARKVRSKGHGHLTGPRREGQ